MVEGAWHFIAESQSIAARAGTDNANWGKGGPQAEERSLFHDCRRRGRQEKEFDLPYSMGLQVQQADPQRKMTAGRRVSLRLFRPSPWSECHADRNPERLSSSLARVMAPVSVSLLLWRKGLRTEQGRNVIGENLEVNRRFVRVYWTPK